MIDPISFPYSIAPGGTFTQTGQEGDTIADCQADGLTSNVNVNVDRVQARTISV